MKYTFQKFKIQLVTKPNTLLHHKNNRFLHDSKKSNSIIRRQTRTAQFSRTKNHHFYQQTLPKSKLQFHSIDNQMTNMTRSQSLQTQVKEIRFDRYSLSNFHNSQRQKQLKIFEQKCIYLLSKKSKNSQIDKKLLHDKNSIARSNKLFFRQQQGNSSSKQGRVQIMMNNIIQRFKEDSRMKIYYQKQKQRLEITNNLSNMDDKSQKSFFTIKNEFAQFANKNVDLMSKQQQNQIFNFIKSTELRRNYSQKNNPQCILNQSKFIFDNKNNKSSDRYDKEWKQVPDITGVRVNRRLAKDQYPKVNPVICTSMSLNSPHKDLRKTLIGMQNIKLNPQNQIISAIRSSASKRKKIHLNKPSNLKKFMKFNKNSSDQQYNKKIKAFLDFLFKINFSNNIYISLQLATLEQTVNNNHKYKVYVGLGNNCLLIKSLLKRRSWIQLTDNINQQGIQFYWTQNKLKQVHIKQEKCQTFKKFSYNSQNTSHQRKKSSFKQLNDFKQLNQKILSSKKIQLVQDYIFEDGYQIPFQKDYQTNIVTNHIPQNYVIGSKKNLFKSLFSYYTNMGKDPFSVIPKTYHVKSLQDTQYRKFFKENSKQPNKLWIIKPGQNTNRGTGIKLKAFSEIESLLKQKVKHPNGHLMTYIVQSYINKPFLYNGRKFDIRHYMLVTSVNGIMKVYWYRDGYIRTSSQFFDLQESDNQLIHLTNDAIQMNGQNYGKYQDANKLSYSQFQRYLDYSFTGKGYMFDNIVKQMKSIMLDVVKSSYLNMDKDRKRDNFQLFGFDFMLDKDFKPYLIQINFNPCLVVNCNVLNRIIPALIQNTLRLGLDPLFPPKNHLPINKRMNLSENYLKNLRYQLIFDQSTLDTEIYNKIDIKDSDDEQDQYCDDGKQLPQNVLL